MNTVRLACLITALSLLSSYCVYSLYNLHTGTRQKISRIAELPTPFIKASILDFPGLASDYFLLNTISFMGEKALLKEETNQFEWLDIYKNLKLSIELDPYATDAFILATTTLPWEAGMIKETNDLLEKVAKLHPHDYRPYFFLWFNYYYFNKDLKTAAIYLKKAASIPDSPKYFPALAARMQLYSGELEGSIAYTQEIIKDTSDPEMRQYYLLRLEALRRIFFLENAIRNFKNKFGINPKELDDLVSKGIVDKIPSDPYGGQFYLLDNGRVYTTSKLVKVKKNAPHNTKKEK